jgi:hypothetical protein
MTEAPPDRHIYLSIAKIGPHRHYWVVWSVSYRDKDRPVIAHSDQGNRAKPMKSFLRTPVALWVIFARGSVLLLKSRLKNRST